MKEKREQSRTEKQEAGSITLRQPFFRWLDNFWYHYKWHTIITAFFVFVIVFCTVQCATRESFDTYVAFSGEYELTEAQEAEILGLLEDLAEETGGEEPLKVGLLSYAFYSEDTLRALYTDSDGQFDNAGFQTAKQYNASRFGDLRSLTQTGTAVIWFLSPEVYEGLSMETLAVPLDKTFGDAAPEQSFDGCAIRLGDTEWYQYYSALQVLPEDTLLVLSGRNLMTGAVDEQTYAKAVKLYRAIVEFEAP